MTVQGPVKEQQPDGMSHRGGGGGWKMGSKAPPPLNPIFSPALRWRSWGKRNGSEHLLVDQGGLLRCHRPSGVPLGAPQPVPVPWRRAFPRAPASTPPADAGTGRHGAAQQRLRPPGVPGGEAGATGARATFDNRRRHRRSCVSVGHEERGADVKQASRAVCLTCRRMACVVVSV